jgi:predicted helicase
LGERCVSIQAIEEMLIQHLLTERIFRRVFNNSDFAERNIIAREIEKVIQALTASYFSRQDFLKSLDRFYGALEAAADTIDDYSQKQTFLNTVYEKFFQGFSVKLADTHGIVYTPQPIVDFMVRSVEDILQREFGRSLSSQGVHILDPFVGTGNFIMRIMREMRKTALEYKYKNEIHCNEVMLLPYYVSSMNIEHEYYDLTGSYEPFEGVCLVDTFELAEDKQFSLFTTENTERVKRQKNTPIFVIISNPPYNARQVNENDNNKNRKYPSNDKRVAETYAKNSRATNKNALSDVYVKAIRLASDRLGEEGIIAFISNNSFIDEISFDGMRRHLTQDFNVIYLLDLGGNVRKNPKLSGTTHNVFGIQVGVSINFFIKKKDKLSQNQARILHARTDEFWRKGQKYEFLDKKIHSGNIEWKEIYPDKSMNWSTEGLSTEFETGIPIGTKEIKSVIAEHDIFKNYGRGIATCRDTWVYNFSRNLLAENVKKTIQVYNEHIHRWVNNPDKSNLDDFVIYDEKRISWSRDLKNDVKRGRFAKFDEEKIRASLYRPFSKQYLFFDRILNEEVYQFPEFFPLPSTENDNSVICIPGMGNRREFGCLMTNIIPSLDLAFEKIQCFPFYTYDEDGTNRQENITGWVLEQFRAHYSDTNISKRDIFHYVYAVLHHPQYRETYAANLKRELPRIPFTPDFWGFVEAGKQLAQLHVHYEEQEEYTVDMRETPGMPLNWRVEKMRLSKDKTQIVYNDFLTLAGIPPETFEYRLGNRSALDWVIDQYQVSVDKRSGIVNDPNRSDEPQYIVRLIGKVITVSLETMKIVKSLPLLD